MKRHPLLFAVFLGLVVLPQQVSANAGTPLMWAGMIHLVIGNAVIGLLEGFLLAWVFGVSKVKSVASMILANYASAWLGGLFIRGKIVESLPMDLNNGWMWFWVMVVMTYGMTLVLEWPFVAWCFRDTQNWIKRSLRASIIIQSASYVLLFGWYWMASGTSLYTRMHIVDPVELSLPQSVLVYYISTEDGNVYRRHLTGGREEKVLELQSTGSNDRLFVRPSTPDTNRWDLVARLEEKGSRDPRLVNVMANLSVDAVGDTRIPESDTWFNFGEAQGFGKEGDRQWTFHTGFWPVEGLEAKNKTTGVRAHFAYETPFGAWIVRNATHLPSDKVLFQFGHDQICAFDPVERRVGLLWHGRGPVAVIEKP